MNQSSIPRRNMLGIALVATLVAAGCSGATRAIPTVLPSTAATAAAPPPKNVESAQAAIPSCGPESSAIATAAPAASSAPADAEPPPGRIAFRRYAQDSDRAGALLVIDPNGSHEHQITASEPDVLDREPNWSPDGSHLVFTHNTGPETDHETRQLTIIANDGTDPVALTSGLPGTVDEVTGFDDSGAFSPDGRLIGYSHSEGSWGQVILHSDLWVMDADGQHPHEITHFPPNFGSEGGQAWSPDARSIVFSITYGATSTPTARGRALFLINVDGTGLCQLTPWSLGANGTPDWSASSNLIVFRAVADEESGKGNFFTIRPDGTGLAQITHFADTAISHKVGFSPDGQWIVFGKVDAIDTVQLFIARVDGTDVRPVTHNARGGSAPDWGPPA